MSRPPRSDNNARGRAGRAPQDDPRRILCDQKYFGLRPQPLEQYVYRRLLSRLAERVFWLHWDLGRQRGDFTSEITVREVESRCWCSRRSVFYAYQDLKGAGLLRRQGPGRDPRNPYREPTRVTEVLLPSTALRELLSARERRRVESLEPASDVARLSQDAQAATEVTTRYGPRAMKHVLANCSPAEVDRLSQAQRHAERGEAFTFAPDENTRLAQPELAFIRHFLQRYADQVRTERAIAVVPMSERQRRKGFRLLNTFGQALVRRGLAKIEGLKDPDARFREIVWSVEEGEFAKADIRLAINAALKLVRDGHWTRPKRMPPNWRL